MPSDRVCLVSLDAASDTVSSILTCLGEERLQRLSTATLAKLAEQYSSDINAMATSEPLSGLIQAGDSSIYTVFMVFGWHGALLLLGLALAYAVPGSEEFFRSPVNTRSTETERTPDIHVSSDQAELELELRAENWEVGRMKMKRGRFADTVVEKQRDQDEVKTPIREEDKRYLGAVVGPTYLYWATALLATVGWLGPTMKHLSIAQDSRSWKISLCGCWLLWLVGTARRVLKQGGRPDSEAKGEPTEASVQDKASGNWDDIQSAELGESKIKAGLGYISEKQDLL